LEWRGAPHRFFRFRPREFHAGSNLRKKFPQQPFKSQNHQRPPSLSAEPHNQIGFQPYLAEFFSPPHRASRGSFFGRAGARRIQSSNQYRHPQHFRGGLAPPQDPNWRAKNAPATLTTLNLVSPGVFEKKIFNGPLFSPPGTNLCPISAPVESSVLWPLSEQYPHYRRGVFCHFLSFPEKLPPGLHGNSGNDSYPTKQRCPPRPPCPHQHWLRHYPRKKATDRPENSLPGLGIYLRCLPVKMWSRPPHPFSPFQPPFLSLHNSQFGPSHGPGCDLQP